MFWDVFVGMERRDHRKVLLLFIINSLDVHQEITIKKKGREAEI